MVDFTCDDCGHVFVSQIRPKYCMNCGVEFNQATQPKAVPSHQLRNGYRFEGQLNSCGEPSGQGVLSNENESIEGEFVNGMVVGIGKRLNLRNDSYQGYVGEFRDNKPHGFGKETYGDGFCYREGNWIEGSMTGQGSRKFRDGTILTGEFLDGAANGYAVEKYRSGNEYRGHFVADRKEGKGRETFANGSVYEGTYQKGYFQGRGRYSFPDGTIWEGEFIRYRGPFDRGTANFWHIKCDDGTEQFGHIQDDGTFISYKLKRFLNRKAFFPASW